MIIMSNAGSPKTMPKFRKLGEDLAALVSDRQAPKFSLGIKLDVQDNGRVKVLEVVPSGAAERDGLRAGDVLLKAGDKLLGENPGMILGALLEKGEAITLEIERGGKLQTLTVKPNAR